MPGTVALQLIPAVDITFKLEVKECSRRVTLGRCPSTPKWVTDLVKTGQSMSLSSLIIQAGRHFSDKLNMEVSDGSATRRQLASALAWTIISMVRPTESNNRLVVMDPDDTDIKRLCSEILGVGAALELVRAQKRIDGRTIKKLGKRFDFQARILNGVATTLIEAKGTFEGVSKSPQRKSFFKKLTPGKRRSYSSEIGVIFSTWTDPLDRGCDVEILDPEEEPIPAFEETVREVILFYARRFDDVVGKQDAAKLLCSIAKSPHLIKGDEPLLTQLSSRHKRVFSRGAMNLHWKGQDARSKGKTLEFWGSFWEIRAIPLPPIASVEAANYTVAYTGIDSRIVRLIEERQFSDLLSYTQGSDRLFVVQGEDFTGHFQLDEYGILRGWMNKVPMNQLEFEVSED